MTCTDMSTCWIQEECAGTQQSDPSTCCYTLAGSTFAERTARSLALVGDTPLHEAAERSPADALRVFMWRHHRTYTDESPVCNAGPAEHELAEMCIPASPSI